MFTTLIAFFAVLGILVLVHEAGHFFVARYFKVKVEEFGLGLPPRLFGVRLLPAKQPEAKEANPAAAPAKRWQFVWGKKNAGQNEAGTIYSLNWIPLGGFVKIKGEEGEGKGEKDSFVSQSIWRRILIISAGVSMNIILAAIFLTFSLGIGSPQVIEDQVLPKLARVSDIQIRIMEVLPETPAAQAGIMAGDSVLEVDGQNFTEIEALRQYFNQKVGIPVNLKIKRDKAVLEKTATPIILAETKAGGIGMALVKTGFISYPWYAAGYYGTIETFKMAGGVIYGFYSIIKNLIVSQQMIGEVYGPIGIAGLVGDATRMGLLYLLQFTAVLSVIIAVINFLPFPALDGGRVFFLLIEAVRRKPVNQQVENLIHNIGFALLMLLLLLVTFRDLFRLSSGFINWWGKVGGLF